MRIICLLVYYCFVAFFLLGHLFSSSLILGAAADRRDAEGSNVDDDGVCAATSSTTTSARNSKEEEEDHSSAATSRKKNEDRRRTTDAAAVGTLRPSDLPPPEIFTDFVYNTTTFLPGKPTQQQEVWTGSVPQINQVDSAAAAGIAVLPRIVERDTILKLRRLLNGYDNYDADPDTVDGMCTYEIFVDSPDLDDRGPSMKVLDSDPDALPERNLLRQQLRSILHPILNDRITPFVRQQYGSVCNQTTDSSERSCTPCYSLIRRYRHGERQSHATHHDGHALVTVVVSLSDFDTDYRGGLYVSTGYGQRKYIALQAGDAVSHQSTLLHGVKVLDLLDYPERTERWSWILWYRDSVTCDDYSHEWFRDCSNAGDAVCQELHSTKVGNIPGLSGQEQSEMVVTLNRVAAEHGSGNAAIKMARAYLKHLPSNLPFDYKEAVRYYELAIQSHHPDGHYGMANLLLTSLNKDEASGKSDLKRRYSKLQKVVRHLEEAALLGHAFSMFNLGIAHVYGYGMQNNRIDADLAALWLVESGLPEGYYIAAFQAASVGDTERQHQMDGMARILGFYEPWRKEARQRTGSGGAGGVDINLPWPTAHDGRRPPVF